MKIYDHLIFLQDKINSTLVNKITHLENKNALLTEQLKSAEEKLLNVTSERDALIRYDCINYKIKFITK